MNDTLIKRLQYAFSLLRYNVDEQKQCPEDADMAKSAIRLAIEDAERIETELARANRYLNNVVTQCNVYIPLREAIVEHLEKYRTK